jgi:hypothetical protein
MQIKAINKEKERWKGKPKCKKVLEAKVFFKYFQIIYVLLIIIHVKESVRKK